MATVAQIEQLITREKTAGRVYMSWLLAQLAAGIISLLLGLPVGNGKNPLTPLTSIGASLVLWAAKIPWDVVKIGRDRVTVWTLMKEELGCVSPDSQRARKIDSELWRILRPMAGAHAKDEDDERDR